MIRPYRTKCPDYGVARARHDAGIRINAAHTPAQLPHKTIPEAYEIPGLRIFEPKVVKKTPRSHATPGQAPAPDSAEPSHQKRRVTPGNSVCHEKIDVFLKKDRGQDRSCSPACNSHRRAPLLRKLRMVEADYRADFTVLCYLRNILQTTCAREPVGAVCDRPHFVDSGKSGRS